MDIAILGSDEKGGSIVAGITEGVCGVAGGAEGATSGIGSHVSWYLNRFWLLWLLWMWNLWMLWSSWGSLVCSICCHTRPFVESEYLLKNASALKLRLFWVSQVLQNLA